MNDLSLTDLLSDASADLLREERFEPILRRLFDATPGDWLRVADLCAGLTPLPRSAPTLLAEHADHWFATHLPWPHNPTGGAMVLFMHTGEVWSSMAWYNVGRLRRNRGGESPDGP